MIRAEKDVMEFYFQALRKTMGRKSKKGCGITILNNRMYGKKRWRPLLPLSFEKAYPCMCKLLKRCWAPLKEDRPGFDEIVKVMQGEVADEVGRKEEPKIVVYGLEDDELYKARMGMGEDFGEDEEEGGATRSVISKAKFDALMQELLEEKAENKGLREELAKK